MASSKISIGADSHQAKPRKKRRNSPKARRHSKNLGPKSDMRRDRGKQ